MGDRTDDGTVEKFQLGGRHVHGSSSPQALKQEREAVIEADPACIEWVQTKLELCGCVQRMLTAVRLCLAAVPGRGFAGQEGH
eukprot:363771-Chlamydomonas_euryale.AAC.13